MLMLAEFCNEELRTRTELPERGVAVHQQLTYSLDVYFLQRFMFARFIVTAVRRGTIHLLACLPSPAGPPAASRAWLRSHSRCIPLLTVVRPPLIAQRS